MRYKKSQSVSRRKGKFSYKIHTIDEDPQLIIKQNHSIIASSNRTRSFIKISEADLNEFLFEVSQRMMEMQLPIPVSDAKFDLLLREPTVIETEQQANRYLANSRLMG